jgi:hypothetical protein
MDYTDFADYYPGRGNCFLGRKTSLRHCASVCNIFLGEEASAAQREGRKSQRSVDPAPELVREAEGLPTHREGGKAEGESIEKTISGKHRV